MIDEERAVVVATRDRLFGEAVAAWLDAVEGWRSAGVALDGLHALALVTKTGARRVLVVGDLPRLGADALARQIHRRSPETSVVAIGAGEAREVHALDPVADAAAVLDALSADTAPSSPDVPEVSGGLVQLHTLTPRERVVLRMLTRGATHDEIANELGVSRHTVRTHMQNLYAKLGVHSRVELVQFGARHGLLSRDRRPAPPAS